MNNFYNEILTEHNVRPEFKYDLECPTIQLEGVNPNCGDDIWLNLVMKDGVIEQIGSPWEIYFRPATRFVADFVGTVNFLEGTAHREADGSLSVDHRGMRLRVDEDTDLQGGEPVTLVVRPEGISLMGLEETVPEGTALRGTIENYSFLGRMIRYWVRVGEEVFVIDDANVDLTGARTGDVQLRLDTRKLHVLKGGGADAAG